MLAMRESPAVYTYTYPEPKSFHDKPEQSVGRAPLCELALRKLGANDKADVEKAFLSYLAGDEKWRTMFAWKKLESKPWWKVW